MPTADLLNHPDYKYLVRHQGEPNLSLLGGPAADITPANLLKKLMVKWSEEAEETSVCTAPVSRAHAGDAVMPERWEEAGGPGGSDGAMAQRDQGGLWGRAAPDLPRVSSNSPAAAAGRRRKCRRRSKKILKPSAEAVSMANSGLYLSSASTCSRAIASIRPSWLQHGRQVNLL